jgi:hypothetical protein
MNGAVQFAFVSFPLSAAAKADCHLLSQRPSFGLGRPDWIHAVAVEILRWDHDRWVILVSVADRHDDPTRLQCLFGVSNVPLWCDHAGPRGLPLVEADVRYRRDVLRVRTVAFPQRDRDSDVTSTVVPLLSISGIRWNAAPVGLAAPDFNPVYEQLQAAPEVAQPDLLLAGRIVNQDLRRDSVTREGRSQIRIRIKNVLYPDLARLLGRVLPPLRPKFLTNPRFDASVLWRGVVTNPEFVREIGSPRRYERPERPFVFPRLSTFGPPSFKFDDLEIVGFRVKVRLPSEAATNDRLAALIRKLNFHVSERPDGGAPEDFKYRAATALIVIELLRYGKMKARDPAKPLRPGDFMCQHELLARVLVGRVDDDASQARDPSLFVPTIFVDNPWSKALGRKLQGFPKGLATFFAGNAPLTMNGADTSGNVVPLRRISEVRLVSRVASQAPQDWILKLEYPDASDGANDLFIPVNVDAFLGTGLLRNALWEQLDFLGAAAEFQRTFARTLMENGFGADRSIQVSPVDDTPLPKTWISGDVILRNTRIAFPLGTATLTLASPADAPPEWKEVVALLSRKPETPIDFPIGSWYRLKCSMDVAVDDELVREL